MEVSWLEKRREGVQDSQLDNYDDKPQEGRRNTPSIRWMITEYVTRSLLVFSMRKDVSESQQMLSL